MTILKPNPETLPKPTCLCGEPVPQWVSTCRVCGKTVAPENEPPRHGGYAADIVLAVIMFVLTNFCLLVAGQYHPFSLPSQIGRVIFLGIPGAAVIAEWYRMMNGVNPDYRKLWRTYWTAQVKAFLGLLIFAALSVPVVVIYILLSWAIAYP